MLLRIAQGDAFGMSCEFRRKNLEAALRFDSYIRHPEWGPEAGCYTDDTQMSIAVARCVLSKTLGREDFAHQFVLCYKRDPRPQCYAQGFQSLLLAIAWGIASARMREDLPPFFYDGLEDGVYGRVYLSNLGKVLMQEASSW